MTSSGMLHRMALVRTGDPEELSASFIRVTMEAIHSSHTSVLTRATQLNIPEDVTLHEVSCRFL
jgi:hypothetical protein